MWVRRDVNESSWTSTTAAGVVRHLVVSVLLSSALSCGFPTTERHHQQQNPHHLNHRHQCPPVTDQSRLNSFLWTLRRKDSVPSYFFGTIHVPYTRVWDYVPLNAKRAFQMADAVHLELDLLDAATLAALSACQLLPHGQFLADVLPRPLFARLRRHLNYVRQSLPAWIEAAGVGRSSGRSSLYAAEYLFDAIAGNWERKRPVYVLLLVNSLTESDVRARGTPVLDLYLAQEADRAGKQLAAVELVEEHCLPLNSMNLSQVMYALDETLSQYEARRAAGVQLSSSAPLLSIDEGLVPLHTADDLVRQYNCGDLNSTLFAPVDNQPTVSFSDGTGSPSDVAITRDINDYFRSELIDKRNRRMAMRIDRLLTDRTDLSFFFAFGAGHFLGNDSLIQLLQKRGYDIQHTPPGEHIDNHYRVDDRRQPSNSPGRPSDTEVNTMLSSSGVISHHRNHRHHHGRRRHRQRHDRRQQQQQQQHPRRSSDITDSRRLDSVTHFNDLWIRLDDTSSFSVDSFLRQQMSQSTTKKPSLDVADVESISANVSSSSSSFCCRTSRLVHDQSLITAAATVLVFVVGWLETHTAR